MKIIWIRTAMAVWTAMALTAAPATGQQFGDVTIETIEVREGVYMLVGAGGNIGLSVGEDGTFMIDDQYAPLTKKILEAVHKLTDRPVRFVINTHWHQDHTGGNENMAAKGAVVVAHENVRKTLSTKQFMGAFGREVPPAPEGALPTITFTESMTFHWNGDELDVVYVGPAHTDGDAIIHFRKANVIHGGDVYFNGLYPFIDVERGGSIDGMIRAADRILELCDEETRLIPGHGPLSGVKELEAYRDMLKTVSGRIRELVDQGKSRDEVIAAKPTADLDAAWGKGFLQPDRWVGIVFDGMAAKAKK
jgi:glyoxylase-like metal-dependent hydrolase (beta-lactamase superfamily II)